MEEYSISPNDEKFQLPTSKNYVKEFERLKELCAAQRALGREIVVVMGLGFVGAVMAAVIADAKEWKWQCRQICHWHAATQYTQFLENPSAKPRNTAGKFGRS